MTVKSRLRICGRPVPWKVKRRLPSLANESAVAAHAVASQLQPWDAHWSPSSHKGHTAMATLEPKWLRRWLWWGGGGGEEERGWCGLGVVVVWSWCGVVWCGVVVVQMFKQASHVLLWTNLWGCQTPQEVASRASAPPAALYLGTGLPKRTFLKRAHHEGDEHATAQAA